MELKEIDTKKGIFRIYLIPIISCGILLFIVLNAIDFFDLNKSDNYFALFISIVGLIIWISSNKITYIKLPWGKGYVYSRKTGSISDVKNKINLDKFIDSNAIVVYKSRGIQYLKLIGAIIILGVILFCIESRAIIAGLIMICISGYLFIDSIRILRTISEPQLVITDNGLATSEIGYKKWEMIKDWEIKTTVGRSRCTNDLLLYYSKKMKNSKPSETINLDDLNITPNKLKDLINKKFKN